MRTLRRVPALTCLGVVVWLASACDLLSGPRLEFAVDPQIRLSLAQSNASGDSLSFGSMMLCVSAADTVATITGVSVHEPQGDIRVEAFAVRINPMPAGQGLGSAKGTLAAIDPAFAPSNRQEVAGLCPADPGAPTQAEASALSELGVQVRLGSGDIAGGGSLDIAYQVNGRSGTLSIPFGIWLCARVCPDGIGESPAPR